MDGVTAERMDARSNRAPEKQSLKQFQRKPPRRSRAPRLRQWGLVRALREYNVVASQLVVNKRNIQLSIYLLVAVEAERICHE